jgi:hypothetical protein
LLNQLTILALVINQSCNPLLLNLNKQKPCNEDISEVSTTYCLFINSKNEQITNGIPQPFKGPMESPMDHGA